MLSAEFWTDELYFTKKAEKIVVDFQSLSGGFHLLLHDSTSNLLRKILFPADNIEGLGREMYRRAPEPRRQLGSYRVSQNLRLRLSG
jgi:hypothetical protein